MLGGFHGHSSYYTNSRGAGASPSPNPDPPPTVRRRDRVLIQQAQDSYIRGQPVPTKLEYHPLVNLPVGSTSGDWRTGSGTIQYSGRQPLTPQSSNGSVNSDNQKTFVRPENLHPALPPPPFSAHDYRGVPTARGSSPSTSRTTGAYGRQGSSAKSKPNKKPAGLHRQGSDENRRDRAKNSAASPGPRSPRHRRLDDDLARKLVKVDGGWACRCDLTKVWLDADFENAKKHARREDREDAFCPLLHRQGQECRTKFTRGRRSVGIRHFKKVHQKSSMEAVNLADRMHLDD